MCHLASSLASTIQDAKKIADDSCFTNSYLLFEIFISSFLDNDLQSIVQIQNEFAKIKKNDDKQLRITLGYFLEIAMLFCQDVISNYQSKDEDYQFYLAKARSNNVSGKDLLVIFSKCKDSLSKNCNGLLVIDRMLYLLYEVIL